MSCLRRKTYLIIYWHKIYFVYKNSKWNQSTCTSITLFNIVTNKARKVKRSSQNWGYIGVCARVCVWVGGCGYKCLCMGASASMYLSAPLCVSVCMCVNQVVSVCLCVCVRAGVWMCAPLCVCTCVCMCTKVGAYVCMCRCMDVCECAAVHVCVLICSVCVCVCVNMQEYECVSATVCIVRAHVCVCAFVWSYLSVCAYLNVQCMQVLARASIWMCVIAPVYACRFMNMYAWVCMCVSVWGC